MKILLATDGSAGALRAAEFLARLRLTGEDEIRMLGVAPLAREEREEAHFGEPRRVLAGSAARIETVTRSGAPSEQILDYSRSEPFDLVALGATGATGLARFFLGSVAERVLRHAETPVLIARDVRHGFERALVAVDASSFAGRVVEQAGRFPLPPETELRLVTALPPGEAVFGVAPVVGSSMAARMEAILRAALEETEERLRGHARQLQGRAGRVSAEVLRGDPAVSLISAAERQQADLIILGSHGEGGMDRFLLGSVSARVARHAPCSVLVIR